MNSQATSRHRIRRKWFYLLSGVVVVGCLTLGTLAFLAFSQSPLDHLNNEDIQSIEANVFEDGEDGGPSNEFQVHPKYYQSILDSLSPSHRDHVPMKWQGLATLSIELRNGRQLAIEIYDTGDQTAAFALDRVYYRGGTERTALDALREAKREATNAEQQNDRNKLE